MFGLISKKKLKKEMDKLLEHGKQKCIGAKFPPGTQRDFVALGYEQGRRQFYDALCHKFFERRMGGKNYEQK